MKIGTIGTGVIVDRMIQAVNMTNNMSIEAVYSRSEKKAHEFAKKHDVKKYYWNLDEMIRKLIRFMSQAQILCIIHSQKKRF